MSRRIILHIGSPKCGSTYLQNVLSRNSEPLAKLGVCYPTTDQNAHPGNAAELKQMTAADFEGLFAPGCDTAILSHEDLYSRPPQGRPLATWAKQTHTQVQVIAFLRPFSEFVFGDYSQFMKQFFYQYLSTRRPYDGMDFEQFALRRTGSLTPAKFLRGWQTLFPDPPLLLTSHRDIRPAMEGLIGHHSNLDWSLPQHMGNPSLRTEDCDRLAASLRDPRVSEDELKRMFQKAHHDTAAPDAGRSPDRIALIENAFVEQNQNLIDEFHYDNRLLG